MEYLAFWVTRDGVEHINTNIESITNTKPPNYRKQVRNFIGVINYYCDMWPRRSHTLATLTKITPNKKKFKWKNVEQDDFDKIKQIVARNNLLTYLDFNETLKSTEMQSRSN